MSERARRIGKNLSILSLGQIISKVIATFVTIYMARALGVTHFGIITFAISIVNYLELIVNWGFQRLGPREVARTPENVPHLVRIIVGLRLFAALSSIVVLGIIIGVAQQPALQEQILLLYGLSLFTLAFNINWVFIGLEQIEPIAITEIVIQVVTSIGIILFVASPSDVLIVPIITLVANAASISILWWVYLRQYDVPAISLRPSEWSEHARLAIPRAMSDAMAMLNFNFDTLMVGIMLGVFATGLYGAAYRIIWMPSMLVTVYFTVLNPSLDNAFHQGFDSVADLLDKSLRFTAILGIGLAVGGTFLAEDGFHLLYDTEFDGGILPFQILMWAVALMFINRNYRSLLISFDYQREELYAMAGAAATNIIMNLVLIPILGLVGAAIATVLSEIVLFVLCYLAVRRHIANVMPVGGLVRVILASIMMALVLFIMPDWNLFIRISIGGAFYMMMIVLVQAINKEEIQIVFNALPIFRRQ